ncbi:Glutathione S-transferase Mu 1 [Amphibalanus amphitrite]|uniref:glutathione transferase n=1 Tax=Amphibalanus amphitrite TaxID=1232801 RepID=A0A6A4VAX8_AMPAM|nr:glutathione S-transferase class-mu 26 kDa isozyme 47-like [Amphibalanus amphitrite]KAF0290812.1 Glutathione S-transferase Mu 1 [Amphibalanus amphitrite]KAF0290813.1 Glutathione S-transferase Mu 1 [Amphibalanus amphitrite]
MPSIFGYWTLRGLGQASRFILEYTGEEYQDVRFDAINAKEKWQEEKTKNPHGLEFPNLPFYVDGDIKLTQSAAILHHLAKKHGLAGANTEEEWRRLDLLEGVLGDVRMTFAWLCYGCRDEASFSAQRPVMRERVTPVIKQLSASLGSKQWLLGDKISYIDFLLYDVLSNWLELEKDLLDELPNLQQFRARFEALPAIKTYMQSERFIKWPLSGPDAFFGGK